VQHAGAYCLYVREEDDPVNIATRPAEAPHGDSGSVAMASQACLSMLS
jgi:hypothetical protein